VKDKLTKAFIRAQVRMSQALDVRESEEGSTTVEYAIGAIATAGFAGLLIAILKSGGVKNMLTSIIQSALSL
jgi:hypothetical protein